jgi:hypothetical protein
MILQTRDKQLLASLSKYGILSSGQIRELFFGSVRHTTMMRRLRILEKEGVILRAMGMPDSESAWYLGMEGAKAIGAGDAVRYTNQNIVHHEVTLSAVRLVLESIGLGEDFTTETELRKEYEWDRNDPKNARRVIPDGIFVANRNKRPHTVALEIELQPKNHARLHRIFTEYAMMSAVARVFYIVNSSGVANLIMDQWNKVQRYDDSPDLYWCYLAELKTKKDLTRVFNADGLQAPLGMIFDCKKSLLSPKGEVDRETAHGVSGKEEDELSRQAS